MQFQLTSRTTMDFGNGCLRQGCRNEVRARHGHFLTDRGSAITLITSPHTFTSLSTIFCRMEEIYSIRKIKIHLPVHNESHLCCKGFEFWVFMVLDKRAMLLGCIRRNLQIPQRGPAGFRIRGRVSDVHEVCIYSIRIYIYIYIVRVLEYSFTKYTSTLTLKLGKIPISVKTTTRKKPTT